MRLIFIYESICKVYAALIRYVLYVTIANILGLKQSKGFMLKAKGLC